MFSWGLNAILGGICTEQVQQTLPNIIFRRHIWSEEQTWSAGLHQNSLRKPILSQACHWLPVLAVHIEVDCEKIERFIDNVISFYVQVCVFLTWYVGGWKQNRHQNNEKHLYVSTGEASCIYSAKGNKGNDMACPGRNNATILQNGSTLPYLKSHSEHILVPVKKEKQFLLQVHN